MPDPDDDRLLRRATRHVATEYDARPIADLRDFTSARYGRLIRIRDRRATLVAKRARHQGRLSISKPALADALEADARPVVVFDAGVNRCWVFDPRDVSREGVERTVESKQAAVGVRDVDPSVGRPLAQALDGAAVEP